MSTPFIGVAGLPRAGSTLLCQLLAEHPDVYCEGHSSPLCNALLATRRFISDDQFFLSQLDVQPETTYANLQSAMQGFLHGWHKRGGKPTVVDKNRAWLHCIELLLQLEPEARLVISIRELGQIYGSIEAQHQKTILVDFIDHLADCDRLERADQLFAKDKSIGAPLSSIQAVQDLPQTVKDRIYFVKFEDLTTQPEQVMTSLYAWLGLAPHIITPQNLMVRPHESDSHYRIKFTHQQQGSVSSPQRHDVPPRIQHLIDLACGWYHEWFYSKQNGL
jgi:sulfotransferase